jgi:starch phosphorylase
MLKQYNTHFYTPAVEFYNTFIAQEPTEYVTRMEEKHNSLIRAWDSVRVQLPTTEKELTELHIDEKFTVSTTVYLGDVSPDDVEVQIYYGPIDTQHNVTESRVMPMQVHSRHGDGTYEYRQQLSCAQAGRYGFTARIVPAEKSWKDMIPGLIKWAQPQE